MSAPSSVPSQPVQDASPAEALAAKAEQAFQDGDAELAINRFSQYLRHFPEGRRADLALFRIGSLYLDLQAYDAALAFFDRLQSEFPDSDYFDASELATIDALILSNQPEAAARRAEEKVSSISSQQMQRKLLLRLGKIAQESGKLSQAALYAYMLYASAEGSERQTWAHHLSGAVSQLDLDAITSLWDAMPDPLARSFLMYRYAVLMVVVERYDDALEVLTAFRHAYPAHSYAAEARQIIESLEQRLQFAPHTVGCLLPLSGPYKLYGQRVLNGVELALSLLTTAEQPAPIRLIIEDTGADENTSVRGVGRLVDAGAGVIIGPIVTALAAATEAQRLNIPMITFTQKTDITNTGDYIYRHFITPQNQVKALVSYFINGVGLHDFGVFYPDEAYGETFMHLFLDEVAKQGGRMTAIEHYDTQQTDFAESIRKLVGIQSPVPEALQAPSSVSVEEAPYFVPESEETSLLERILPDPMTRLTGLFFQDPDQDRVKGPAIGRKQDQEDFNPVVDFDVLFIPDGPKMAGLILPQLAYYDIKDVYLAGTNLWHSPQLIQMASQYAQNAVMADGFFPKSPSPVVQRFVSTYKGLYNQDPGLIEAYAFDTAWILFNLLARPGVQFRHVLRDHITQTYETTGVTGPTAFNENGEAIKKLSLLKVKGKQFLEIGQ